MFVPHEGVNVTAGFAGAIGNLFWFNSGCCDLLLRLITGNVTKSIVLGPGYGFSMGKRERFTKVFLSAFDKAIDEFKGEAGDRPQAHAIFLGCDMGDQESWLGKLNASVQARDYRLDAPSNEHLKKVTKDNERLRRLGIELKNQNHKRGQIRIAPMRGSNLPPDVLITKVSAVEKWIKDTLRCVKSANMPKLINLSPEKEHPQRGEPFDVLWAKFEFEDDMWDDELMWDIRYLLVGSKLDKLPGFPKELQEFREKLYVTRDGISERGRRARMD